MTMLTPSGFKLAGTVFLATAITATAAPVADFGDVTGANTYFAGSWESTGSLVGSSAPVGAFVQGEGAYDIAGGGATNDADSFMEMHFASPMNLEGALAVEVLAQSLSGNEATSFEVRFFDANGASAFATFATSSFPAGSYSSAQASLVSERRFDGTQVEALRVSGAQLNASDAFAISFDEISTGGGLYHSADYNQDGQLSLSELLRVIELYNTRMGTIRTGAYTLSAGSTDGFDTDPTVANGTPINLARYHSGDSDRNGRLSLSELLRVIELYNFREGTVRTGAYQPDPSTQDGFATGPRR